MLLTQVTVMGQWAVGWCKETQEGGLMI